MKKMFSISLFVLVCVLFVNAQEVEEIEEVEAIEEVKVNPQCPNCTNDCFLGREVGPDGCEMCDRCKTTGMFESDILILDPESYVDLVRRYKNVPQSRGLQRNEARKWPKRGKYVTLPITYESTVSATKRKNIEAAMAVFEENTCIRFANRTTETSYIYFSGRGGCSSYVGRTGRRQRISIGTGCDTRQGTIIHEIMHALGFWHEQSRGDRDDHITILWDNIRAGRSGNFQKQEGDWNPLGSPYDLNSVMHYGGYYFSKDGQSPTIVDKQNRPVVAQRVGFSAEDINQINRRYDCTDYPTITTTQATTTTAATTQSTTTTAAAPCVDNVASCSIWKDNGYCPVSSYVRRNCVKSCTGCEGESTTASSTSETTATQPTTTQSPTTTQAPTTATEEPTTTTEEITTESSSNCKDESSSCKYWGERGYCNSSGYENYMRNNCKKTCGYCETTPEPEEVDCMDNHNACEFWAENDFCVHASYSTFMRNNCQKSCSEKGLDGFCGASSSTTTTTRTTITTTTTEMTTTEEATTSSASTATNCADTTSSCVYWETQGFCTNDAYVNYMRRNCQEACGYCQN